MRDCFQTTIRLNPKQVSDLNLHLEASGGWHLPPKRETPQPHLKTPWCKQILLPGGGGVGRGVWTGGAGGCFGCRGEKAEPVRESIVLLLEIPASHRSAGHAECVLRSLHPAVILQQRGTEPLVTSPSQSFARKGVRARRSHV